MENWSASHAGEMSELSHHGVPSELPGKPNQCESNEVWSSGDYKHSYKKAWGSRVCLLALPHSTMKGHGGKCWLGSNKQLSPDANGNTSMCLAATRTNMKLLFFINYLL